MTEVHRVTATPVNWASFQGDCVVSLSSCNEPCGGTGADAQVDRLLLYSTSGAALANVRLSGSGSDDLKNVCCASVNAAGVVACCAKRGSGRSQRTVVFFAAGGEVLASREVPSHSDASAASCTLYSIVCARAGRRDVAVFSLGGGKLFTATRSGAACDVDVLVDFGAARIGGLARGRGPHEVVVLRKDGAVSIVSIDNNINSNKRSNEACASSSGSGSGAVRFHLPVSSTSTPRRAVFSGGSVLWVLCDDESLSGFWFSPAAPGDDEAPPPVRIVEEQLRFPKSSARATEGEAQSSEQQQQQEQEQEEQQQEEADDDEYDDVGEDAEQEAEGKRGGRVLLAGEARSCGVHVARLGAAAVRFGGLTMHSGATPQHPPAPVGWTHSTFVWSGHVHDFTLRHRAYTLLSQSARGASPLCVHTLRQNQSVLLFSPSECHALSHQIIFAAPSQLPALRAACEARVAATECAASNGAADLCAVDSALDAVLDAQHCLMAVLHRERELIADVPAHQSASLQLIRRLHAAFLQLSVARLLLRTGAHMRLDVPLREALALDERRRAAAESYAALHREIDAAFGVPGGFGFGYSEGEGYSGSGSGSGALLCDSGVPPLCAAVLLRHCGAAESQSLRAAAAHLPAVRPALALLALYCTYPTTNNNNNNNSNNNSAWDEARNEFLDAFCLPRSFAQWALLASAADSHVRPPRGSAALAADGAPLAGLFAAAAFGLTAAGAYDTVFELAGPALATCGPRDMDPRVAVEMLFLAYTRGNAPVVEALFRHAHRTAWRPVATRAIAWAALRSESAKLLSGLVAPRSPEEEIVERVFRSCPDGPRADLLLLEFYVLMQRYADGLRVCERMAARGPLDAQRAQVVASHLRSLMPNGNAAFRLRVGEAQNSSTGNGMNNGNGAAHGDAQCAPLHDSAELDEAVARTAMRIAARWTDEWSLRIAAGAANSPQEGGAGAFMPTPAAALVAANGAQEFRPQRQRQRQNEEEKEREEGEELALGAAVVDAGAALQCEAIIRRSGKPCGRRRPCEYHDRAR